MPQNEVLRKEITQLGRLFGQVLKDFAGEDAFDLVEEIRAEARQFRDGDIEVGDQLEHLVADLSGDQLGTVIKAFSGFLELANLAEDRQRVRALRARERESYPAPRKESIRSAIQTLKEQGFTGAEIEAALEKVNIELVFTAHPTEAKRKSLRSKLRSIRKLLSTLDRSGQLPSEQSEVEQQLAQEITKLWQTDLIRPTRPTVLEEVQRGLSFQPVLWETAPRIMQELRSAVKECYPELTAPTPRVLQFGSWMGGDRDGNPHVTPEITEQTFLWLRRDAIESHVKQCQKLIDSLSMSSHGDGVAELDAALAQAVQAWPELEARLAPLAENECYRRWLKVIQWRLEQTAATELKRPVPAGAYLHAEEIARDVELMQTTLNATGNRITAETEIQGWLDQITVFGLCTARLDIRQHAGVYSGVMNEIWQAANMLAEGQTLSEEERCKLLIETLPLAPNLAPVGLSDDARKTLNLFRLLRRITRRFGMANIGGHIMSMTTQPSDILTVLWLWKWSTRTDAEKFDDREELAELDDSLLLPIMPLFETIDDLTRGTDILADVLKFPEYREYVHQQGDQQTVMIGYSDSTKDGGYLAAAWALQRGQLQIYESAKQEGIHVTFFHGRGGSLGRGGGPAARAILSLPSETFDGSLRLTEQGEVLAERYDDPNIAHRHLEQVLWSVLMAATHTSSEETSRWRSIMDQLAEKSLGAYRDMVDHKAFVRFFRNVTPIAGIEQLPIGSRPSRRKGGDRIEDLRAIPWVFSWTQCRCLLPAWYGLGSALAELLEESPAALKDLQNMYRDWRFFRATIDNSILALSKANLPVFRRYVELAGDDAEIEQIAQFIYDEFSRTRQAVLAITGEQELLENVPWLQRSIIVRNGYVDPLNFVQVEIMRRRNEIEAEGLEDSEELEELEELASLTQQVIKGVAAGMRTTG